MAQKTPKSGKKNDKSINKTPLLKNDTPRPPKKQNGVQTPNKKGNATPKKTPPQKTPKTDSKKKTPAKKVEEDPEDDDEEDDDDSEIELNPELMKKLSEMAGDDDDDEEDMEEDDDEEGDDDEEDDDDDDDDDEEDDDDGSEPSLDEDELRTLIESLKGKKSKKGAATESAKKADAAKPEAKKESPKAAKADKKKEQAKKSAPEPAKKADAEPAAPVDNSEYLKSVKERDTRTLFLKDLPVLVKEETIKNLSKDIQGVRIRKRVRKDTKRNICYAFVEFASEEMAEKNHKILSESEIDGKTLTVDYTGEKSLSKPNKPTVIKELDPSKLYITGFPYTTTELELKQLIPKAETVALPIKRAENRPLGFAFAKFADPEVCSQELKRLHGKSFKECTLVVLHANLMRKPKAVKRKSENVEGKAKKAKLDKSKKGKKQEKEEVMEEEDDDDEDEDDDDDDDDSDEE